MTTPTLEFDALELRYGSALRVGPVSGRLGPGIHHLRGENGCGKTSLMRCLSGALRPTSGRCLLSGEDLWGDRRVRRHVGYVPSHPELPTFMRVREAWQFHAAMRGQSDWTPGPWAERLGLDPLMSLGHASAGQRRRAELLSALAADPGVLLMDEVFAYLDEQSVEVVCEVLAQLRATRVIVITAHHDLPIPADSITVMVSDTALHLEA